MVLMENLMGGKYLENLSVDGKIELKSVFKRGKRVLGTELIRLRIRRRIFSTFLRLVMVGLIINFKNSRVCVFVESFALKYNVLSSPYTSRCMVLERLGTQFMSHLYKEWPMLCERNYCPFL
jgi:hypothetical protein